MSAPSAPGPFAHDGALLRRLAYLGAAYGPAPFVRHSPPVIGLLAAALLPVARRRIRENLRRLLGARPAWREQLDVGRTFAAFASCLTESLALGGPSASRIRVERRVIGRENVEEARRSARGLVVVTAHTGAWEVAGSLLRADEGVEVIAAMQGERDAGARAFSDAVRARSGLRVAHVGQDPLAVLPLLSHLRRGGVVAVQIDRAGGPMRRTAVRLFDAEGSVPTGPFLLAAAAGVPVLPAFARRVDHFSYEIEVSAPIVLQRRPGADALAAAAQAAASAMERFLRAHPTHWFDFG